MSRLLSVAGLFLLALNVSCFVLPVLIWKAVKEGDKERQSRLSALLAAAFILSACTDWYLIAGLIALSRI